MADFLHRAVNVCLSVELFPCPVFCKPVAVNGCLSVELFPCPVFCKPIAVNVCLSVELFPCHVLQARRRESLSLR